MKRRSTLRTTLFALIAAPLLLTVAHAEEGPFISIVTGLAPDDLLNVRAQPSPIGKTEARLANGASVNNLGCIDVDGRQWCKVEAENPKISGWTPARYLNPVNPASPPDPDQADASAAVTNNAGQALDAATASPAGAQPPPALPPDLTARLGGADNAAAPATTPKSAAVIAMQDAYGLALVANEPPPTGETPAQAEATAGGVAIEIPCARNVGQPMTLCAASVEHKGSDKADVTVTWPDGGSRVISFYGGLPAGSDGDSDFRFTREGSLSMIRVGFSERFEITDAVAFGK
ncbi:MULTISPECIES: SH3 domain-containing protein [unclassified Mesorhizobium]|uniref:SH3 domain-containing protein n=1 Tax=unclassified Mesorhizobium TaxID=325217 RepID=UPI00112BE311|nr:MULTISPECIES: SH3 domain-containing protein [unclassified Mesorhizobium]MBZ9810187.1 SH3 domain-containing protein [Mesorhizobium sp. ESP-6-2]MBZ9944147.1 SH3 domain-containing protein [Mesorhizobium sp. BR1-1-13]TPM29495.1 SH3 domain-containing protein [Mesorhizobium sp. B2-2-2]